MFLFGQYFACREIGRRCMLESPSLEYSAHLRKVRLF